MRTLGARENSSSRKNKEALRIMACLATWAYRSQRCHRSFYRDRMKEESYPLPMPLRYATHLSVASEDMGKRGGGSVGKDISLV